MSNQTEARLDQIAELQDLIDRFSFDENDEGCLEYVKENLPEDDESDEVLRLLLVIEYWELVYNCDLRSIPFVDEFSTEGDR